MAGQATATAASFLVFGAVVFGCFYYLAASSSPHKWTIAKKGINRSNSAARLAWPNEWQMTLWYGGASFSDFGNLQKTLRGPTTVMQEPYSMQTQDVARLMSHQQIAANNVAAFYAQIKKMILPVSKRMGIPIFAIAIACCTSSLAQDPEESEVNKQKVSADSLRIYRGDGTPTDFDQILTEVQAADVIFVGEYHDDPVAHFFQASLFERLYLRQLHSASTPEENSTSRELVLSLEMFERDVQHILDEYLDDLIAEKHFVKAGRCWSNYETDYRPLIEYAKQSSIAVVAANAPRRYVNLVGREGIDALQQIKRPFERGLPPLPYANASEKYAAKFHRLMEEFRRQRAKTKSEKEVGKASSEQGQDSTRGGDTAKAAAQGPAQKDQKDNDDSPEAIAKRAKAREKSIQAQSLWDASMAYSITEQFLRNPKSQVLHICGSFHCERKLGIPEHLNRYRPGTSFAVITIQASETFPSFDVEKMAGEGDFVVVTDQSLPRSFDASAK